MRGVSLNSFQGAPAALRISLSFQLTPSWSAKGFPQFPPWELFQFSDSLHKAVLCHRAVLAWGLGSAEGLFANFESLIPCTKSAPFSHRALITFSNVHIDVTKVSSVHIDATARTPLGERAECYRSSSKVRANCLGSRVVHPGREVHSGVQPIPFGLIEISPPGMHLSDSKNDVLQTPQGHPVLLSPNLPQTDSNSNGLSPLFQSASLPPSLMEDSNTSSPTRPAAYSGSKSFVAIVSNPPSDGLPNGSVLSEDSRNNEVPKKRLGRTSRPLTIMQWNADGIGNKIFELQEYLVNSNVDVLAVQESKLLSTGPRADKDPKIPGYYIQRKDREDAENRGGGLLFYIKNDVRFQPVNKMERFGLETLTIRVQLKRRDWVKITNCYLPRPVSIHLYFHLVQIQS